MIDLNFWNSKLGQAALASILAMIVMIAVSSQYQAVPGSFATTADHPSAVELA